MTRHGRSITRPTMDASDDLYVLAGRLVGTTWSRDGVSAPVIVDSAYQHQSREQGHSITYPKLRLSTGSDVTVEAFRAMVLDGEIEPAGNIARQIAYAVTTDDAPDDEWPDYACPDCGNDVWIDGFDDATTVAGEDEYREVRHCGVCEFVAIRRNGGEDDG